MVKRSLPGWGTGGAGDADRLIRTGDLLNLHPALAAALDACPTALVMLDAEQCFIRVNAAACDFLGRSHDDLLGTCAVDLLAAETVSDEDEPDLAATALDPDGEADWCFEKPDRSVVWGRVRIMLLGSGDDAHAARLTLIEDVTEARRAQASERSLVKDLHRYQGMFERGSIGQINLAIPGYRIKSVNQAFADMTGYAREDLVGADAEALFMQGAPWDPGPTVSLDCGDVESYVVERGLPHRDGHLIPVLNTVSAVRAADGTMQELSVLTLELTTQREAEHARLDSAMLLAAAIASSHLTVTTFDRELRFTFVAGGGMTRRGRVDSEFVGQHVRDVVTDAPTLAAMEAALDGHETTTTSTFNGRSYGTVHGPLRGTLGDVVGVISVSRDVTAALAVEAVNLHNRALLDAVLDAFPMLVASFDADGRLVDGAGRLFDAYDSAGLVGQRLDDRSTSLAAPFVDRAIAGHEVTATVERDGNFYLGVYRPNLDANGVSIGALAVVTDDSERHRAAALALHTARHDPLTGLPLRATFVESLEEVLRDGHRACAVLLMDVDELRAVNEALGHDAGDAILVDIAASLIAGFPDAMVARVGADEFVVGVPDVSRDAPVDDLVARVCASLPSGSTNRFDVQASIGVAYAEPGGSAETLLRHADSALSQAKSAGRGQTCVFDATLRNRRQEVRTIEHLLRGAIAARALHVEYQPIVSLATRRIVGVEALARWTDAARGVIAPSEFIPIAESSGLIVPIGDWVMRRACADAVALGPGPAMTVSVNVAARQLRAPGFVGWLNDILDRSGLERAALTVEITESALFDDVDRVRAAFEQLRACGVRVAVDDFGTGFSSLSRLQHLPVDIIKLDRAFVIDVASTPQARTIAAAILALSSAIGASIIAEGIETEQQASVLCDLGYEVAQGYLFARPMRLHQLREWVAQPSAA